MLFELKLLLYSLLFAILVKESLQLSNKNDSSLASTLEQRHERLLKLKQQNSNDTTNQLRYKPSNKLQQKFGSTKLNKPITNSHISNGTFLILGLNNLFYFTVALQLNSPPKSKLHQKAVQGKFTQHC